MLQAKGKQLHLRAQEAAGKLEADRCLLKCSSQKQLSFKWEPHKSMTKMSLKMHQEGKCSISKPGLKLILKWLTLSKLLTVYFKKQSIVTTNQWGQIDQIGQLSQQI